MTADVSTTLTGRVVQRSRAIGVNESTLPLIVGFLLLAAVGGAIVWLVTSSQRQSQLVFNVFEVQRATSRVFRTVLGAESGQRGYLLTGEDRYLAPYTAAVGAVDQAVQDLKDATAPSADLSREAAALTTMVQRKMAELDRTVGLQRGGRRTDALALIDTDVGRELMEKIRSIVDRIQLWATRAIDVEYEEAQSLNKSLLLTTLAALAVIVIMGALVIRIYRRAMAEAEAGRAASEMLSTSLEEAVAERTTELVESNEEIQRFAYIVSHDLRAPLVNVMGFTSELEALKDDLLAVGAKPAGDPDRGRVEQDFTESIGFIKAAIDKMEGLIAAILRLSREGRRTFQPEAIDTVALVESLADAQRHQATEAGATVTVHKDLPRLMADRVALEQVLGNLLDNAIKYLDPSRPGRIEVSGATIGSRARISVQDNGRGIAEHDHKRVFELFRRSGEQNKPGEGIGLAHVQTLVRSLGGRITVASKLGEGTTFTVVLPLSPKTADAAA